MNNKATRGYWVIDKADFAPVLRCSVCGNKNPQAPEMYCPNCGADMNGAAMAENTPAQGEWLINSDGWYAYCSNCKEEPSSGKKSKYCPNCGADMGGTERGVTQCLQKKI